MEAVTIITVTFEDHMQDFLEWDICDREVIDCRPFQASLWVGSRLLEPMDALKVGHKVRIIPPMEGIGELRIKYPLTKVEVKVPQPAHS